MINGTPEEFVAFMDQFWLLFLLIAIWSIIWKGLALWRAAGRGNKWWFVILLVLNTVGILEIIYLFLVTNGFKTKDIVKVDEEKNTQN